MRMKKISITSLVLMISAMLLLTSCGYEEYQETQVAQEMIVETHIDRAIIRDVNMMSSMSDIVIRAEVVGEHRLISQNNDLMINELRVLEVFQGDISVGDNINSPRIRGAQTAIGDDMIFFLRYIPEYSRYVPRGIYHTPPIIATNQHILNSNLPADHVMEWHFGDVSRLTVGDLRTIIEIEEMRQGDFMVSLMINTNGGPDIYDSRGNRIIFDSWNLFIDTPENGRQWVGDASRLSWETWEMEYRLIPDEYTIRNMNFNFTHLTDIIPAITTTTTINHLYDSFVHYHDIPTSPHLELRVSPATTQLYNTLTRTVIEPTHIASPAELREMNERAGRLTR